MAAYTWLSASASAQIIYEYDELGRLTSISNTRTLYEQEFEYDAEGNRISMQQGAVEDRVRFAIGDVSVEEGADAVFTVTKTGTATQSFSVNFSTSSGSAMSGSDFSSQSGVLTFAQSEVSKTISVTTVNDSTEEQAESFFVNLSSPSGNAVIIDDQGIGTITDNDGPKPVAFVISDTQVAEGRRATFIVTRMGTPTQSHIVNYETEDGTAVGGDDYTAVSGGLVFLNGDITKTIEVNTSTGGVLEGDEFFTVRLTSVGGIQGTGTDDNPVITDGEGIGSIIEDPPPPVFAINDVTVTEGEAANFTVTKYGVADRRYTVRWATLDGTAVENDDYLDDNGTLRFEDEEYTKTVSVSTIDDAESELEEFFRVELSNPTFGSTIDDAIGIATLNDNDAPLAPIFSISDASAAEGGSIVFTVTKTGMTSQTLSVNFATANGSANDNTDYVAQSGTLTFAPSVTQAQITVVSIDDTTEESSEQFFVNLSAATGGATIGDAQGIGAINDNDAPPPPSFAISDASITEGGAAVFTITKTGVTSQSFSVDFTTSDDTATQTDDYFAVSTTITFASNQTTKTVSVSTVSDAENEGSEQFFANLSAPTGGATIADTQGIGTIFDDTGLSFSINDVAIDENESAVFTVTMTGSAPQGASISFATANGSANAVDDYVARSGVLDFTATDTSKTITISVVDDTTPEPSEFFRVNLSNPTNGATIADAEGRATITDDDANGASEFSINSLSDTEGQTVVLSISRSGDTSQVQAVEYTTTDGTAVSGSDYAAQSGTITFLIGDTTASLSINTLQDTDVEGDEVFHVDLSNPTNGATIFNGRGNITILDDDELVPPSFSIGDVTVDEGGTAVFTVTKTGEASQSFSVDYATQNDSAISGVDYTAQSGTLTFLNTETSKTISVPTIGDAVEELTEQFFVNLSNASGGTTISDAQGVGTINDDDETTASFSINDISINEDETAVFTVTMTGQAPQGASVGFATADGSALVVDDYLGASGVLDFAATDVSKTLTITVVDDAAPEPAEFFRVNLSNPTNGATIADAEGRATITDNDASAASEFSINNLSVTEGQTAVLTISRSGDTSQVQAIDYTTTNGTAVAGSDYSALSGTVTFLIGDTSASLSINTLQDTDVEDDEIFYVDLSSPTNGATIFDGRGDIIIENDDVLPPPSFSISDVSVDEGATAVFTVTKTGAASQSYSVSFATQNASAVSGSDYTAQSGTLTFLDSESSKTISVPTTDDSTEEPDEQFFVNLSAPTDSATISDAQGVGTINANDAPPPPSFAISDATVTEGGDAVFTVTKTGANTSVSHVLDYATADDTAIAGNDYTAASGTIAFFASDVTKTISISTITDVIAEPAEYFEVSLSNPTNGATITDALGVGQIDDAPTGGVSFSVADVTVTEGGTAFVTVTKTGGTDGVWRIDVDTADGTALDGSDYNAESDRMVFRDDDAQMTMEVTIVGDTNAEGTEEFYVNLSNPYGGATISDGQAVVTILDDD